MHVFSKRPLREFWTKHPQAAEPLKSWFSKASKAEWRKFAEVRDDFGSVDLVGPFLVFNIGGNKYRLIVWPEYALQRLYVRAILTHDEYDDGDWKYEE
ncbi:MAG: type II toxin-antitoxin system HigB family toxin [Planctomycetes bacterium]|nr:type II toxin-antitoxin system HigB family toxin [Planctomycetota bacterium]